jgi:type IV pilus assembly protein PilW
VKLLYYSPKNKQSGFTLVELTLVELLIAMTIGLIMLAALSSTFLMQRKIYDVQEQIVELVQTTRAAMDMMTTEIRMAGYDPTGSAGAEIITASTNSIRFTMDTTGGESDGIDNDGDGNVDEANEDEFGDGDTSDSNEHITYSLYTEDGIQKLGRKSTSTAVNQPVVEHVQSLEFQYWDEDGVLLATPFPAADVRRIEVAIKVRTAKPDADYSANNGYRTHTLTSFITPRNLGL